MSAFNPTSYNPYEEQARRLFGTTPRSSFQLGSTRPDLLNFMTQMTSGNQASGMGSTPSGQASPVYTPAPTPGTPDAKTPTPTPAKVRRVSPQDIEAANSIPGIVALMGDADMMEDSPYKRSVQTHLMDRMRKLRREEGDAARVAGTQKRAAQRIADAESRDHAQWVRFMEEVRPGSLNMDELGMDSYRTFMNSPDRYAFQQWKAGKAIRAGATAQPGTLDPLAAAEASNKAIAAQTPADFDLAEGRRLGMDLPTVDAPIKTPGAQMPQGRDIPSPASPRTGGLSPEEIGRIKSDYDKARLDNAYRGAFNRSIEGQQFSQDLDMLNRLMDNSGMQPQAKTYLMDEIRSGRISVPEAIRTLQSQKPLSPAAVRSAINVGRQESAQKTGAIREVSALDAYKEALLRGDITPEEYQALVGPMGY